MSKTFFEKYAWIDKYRALILMSPSVYTYHEMAMMNLAYIHLEKEDIFRAAQYYRETINHYPENQIAAKTLKLILDQSVKSTKG